MAEVTRVDIEWSCPTCTYINKAGSFKCSVCGTLKGTATRQVKYHLSTLEQQYMSETLQSNRIHSARSLARLHGPSSLQTHGQSTQAHSSQTSQAHGHASQAHSKTSQAHGHASQAHGQAPSHTSQAPSHTSQAPNHTSQAPNHTSQAPSHTSQSHSYTFQDLGHTSQAQSHSHSAVSQSHSHTSKSNAPGSSSSGVPSVGHGSSQETTSSKVSGATVKKRHRLRLSTGSSSRLKSLHTSKWPKLRNIDRSRIIRSQEITVGDVMVTITEYPLLYPDSD